MSDLFVDEPPDLWPDEVAVAAKPWVQLTPDQIMLGVIAGAQRQIENIERGRVDAHGATRHQCWQMHIEGTLGEMAFAQWRGVYWSGKGRLRAADVAGMQVRTSSHRHDCRLRLHETDDDAVFWLMCGLCGRYSVEGWLRARDGKVRKYWGDPFKTGRPAFWVPVADLHDPREEP